MNAYAPGRTYVFSERFHKAVKLIHRALTESDLSVVSEFDTTGRACAEPGKRPEPSRILLVDSPLLAFEAQALDRAAGVFLPLHVFVGADGDRTQVFIANSSDLFHGRLPLGAAGPVERLRNRISLALESVLIRADGSHENEGEEQ